MLRGQVLSSSGGGSLIFWNVARSMKRSASVKLLGRGSAETSSCLAFELRGHNLSCSNMCRVTRPARKHLGQLLGYEVRLEAALQLSSVIKKRGLIFRVGGRVTSLQRL